jgi:hypothetical protein
VAMGHCKAWPYVPALDNKREIKPAKNSTSGKTTENALLNTSILSGLLTARITVPKIRTDPEGRKLG